MNKIVTYSGLVIDFANPSSSSISIDDIAHSLSMMCRYAGHTKLFYSVAQHSVLVSKYCQSEYALEGLLHDGSEAYIADIVTPAEKLLPDYSSLEEKLMKVIYENFNIISTSESYSNVKLINHRTFVTEVRDIDGEQSPIAVLIAPPFRAKIVPWSPKKSEREFLKRFYELWQPKQPTNQSTEQV